MYCLKISERNGKAPVGYTKITCHLVFDLNLDMARKYWYVAGGHLIDIPTHMTYLIFMSHDTVRIRSLMDAMNRLNILAGDIQNAFLEAPMQKKILFYSGN